MERKPSKNGPTLIPFMVHDIWPTYWPLNWVLETTVVPICATFKVIFNASNCSFCSIWLAKLVPHSAIISPRPLRNSPKSRKSVSFCQELLLVFVSSHLCSPNIERQLNKLSALESKRLSGTAYFRSCPFAHPVSDDHLPFIENDIPVLHLIATPFPRFWHTVNDDAAHMHHPTINNLMKIFKVYLIQYFDLWTFLFLLLDFFFANNLFYIKRPEILKQGFYEKKRS